MKASHFRQILVVFLVLVGSSKTDGSCTLGEPEKYTSGEIVRCRDDQTCSPFYRCYLTSDWKKKCCLDSYLIICKCPIISDVIATGGTNGSIQVTAEMATHLKVLGDNITVDCRDAALSVGQTLEADVVVDIIDNNKTNHVIDRKRITCKDRKSDCQRNLTFYSLPTDKKIIRVWITAINPPQYICAPNSNRVLKPLNNSKKGAVRDSPRTQNTLQILLPSGLLILTVISTTLIFIYCRRCKRHTMLPPDMSLIEEEDTPILSFSSKDVLIVSTPTDRPKCKTDALIKKLEKFPELKLFYPEKEQGCVALNVDRWIHKTFEHCGTVLVIMTRELVSGSEINSNPFYQVSKRLFNHVLDYMSCNSFHLSKCVLFVFLDMPDEIECLFDVGICHNRFTLVGDNEIYNQNFRFLVEVLYNDINIDDKVVYLNNILNSGDCFCNGRMSDE